MRGVETSRWRGRRSFGALAGLSLLCASVALAPGGSEAKKRSHHKQKRPNIVVIMDDDQSAEQQRFLPKTNAAIGGSGVTFDNSFVNYSLCCPSRSTYHTAQYATNNGVRTTQPPTAGYSKLAPTLYNSLPGWLQWSGYYTGQIWMFV